MMRPYLRSGVCSEVCVFAVVIQALCSGVDVWMTEGNDLWGSIVADANVTLMGSRRIYRDVNVL